MERSILANTSRLLLRRYEPGDLRDLYEYLSDPEVVRFEPYLPMSLEETRENLKWRISTAEMIAVELKDGGKLIGNLYLGKREFDSLELGYVFNCGYWGKGYAKESCAAMLEKSFGEGVHRVYAECDPQNPNSWRLLESLGFEREGCLKRNVYFHRDSDGNPIWKDTFVYGLLNKRDSD